MRKEKNSKDVNVNGDIQYTSRKWKLVVLVVILATVGALLPPLISAWLLAAEKPLVILTGTEWVSIVTLSVSAYFGANVWQKHVQRRRYRFDMESSGVQGGYDDEYGNAGDEDGSAEDEDDDTNKEA